MDHYVMIGADDADASLAFYDAVFATIGFASHFDYPGRRAYSMDGSGAGFSVWIAPPFDGGAASPGNGMMVGFAAPSRAAVDAFYAAGLGNGGSDEGAPGPRPRYGPDWYSAYLRDPAGNKLAIAYNG